MIALHHLKAYRIRRNERGKGWFKKERIATVNFLVVLFFLVPYQITHRGEGSPAGTTRNKLFLVRQLMSSQRLTARKWFVTLVCVVECFRSATLEVNFLWHTPHHTSPHPRSCLRASFPCGIDLPQVGQTNSASSSLLLRASALSL